LALPVTASAQTGTPPAIPGLFTLGMSDPNTSDSTVNDLRIPAGYTIIQPDDRGWGLRLRLIVYAGIYDLDFANAADLNLRFQSLAATPGVEFLVPVGKGWTLKPFTEIGYAWDFDDDLGLGVWSFGLRTLTEWQPSRISWSLGTKVQYLSTFGSDFVLSDQFFELQVGLDVGLPLGLDIKGSEAYLSPYAIRRQFINVEISRPEGEPVKIDFDNEIGLAFGTRPKIKLWFVTLPRIGIGYRWGPNIDGWRLSFGFPF
jgi:hypothetical protein